MNAAQAALAGLVAAGHPVDLQAEVTLQRIQEGKPRSCASCPVALAVLAAWGDLAVRAAADPGHLTVWLRDGQSWMARTPWPALVFMASYDVGEPVEPVAFTATFRPVAA